MIFFFKWLDTADSCWLTDDTCNDKMSECEEYIFYGNYHGMNNLKCSDPEMRKKCCLSCKLDDEKQAKADDWYVFLDTSKEDYPAS